MSERSPRRRLAAGTAAAAVVALTAACSSAAPDAAKEAPAADIAFANSTPEAAGPLDEAIWLTTTEPSGSGPRQ